MFISQPFLQILLSANQTFIFCTDGGVPTANYPELRIVLKNKLSTFESSIDRTLIAAQLQCADSVRTALVTSKAAAMMQLLISCKVRTHCAL